MPQSAFFSPDVVQNVGDIDIAFAHAKIFAGQIMHVGGFRLQGEFINLEQLIENSVLVPILGGGSVQLTNNNLSGRITFNSIRTGSLVAGNMPAALDSSGIPLNAAGGYVADAMYDIVSIADALRMISGGDGIGGSFKITTAFNGSDFSIFLRRCTMVKSPIYVGSGTDAPNYQTIFNFSRPIIAPINIEPQDIENDIYLEALAYG